MSDDLHRDDSPAQVTARRNLAMIERLRKAEAFTDYFLPQVRKLKTEAEATLRDTSKSGRELKRIQREVGAFDMVLKILDEDERGAASVLRQG